MAKLAPAQQSDFGECGLPVGRVTSRSFFCNLTVPWKPLNFLDEPVEKDYDDKMLEMLAFIRKSAEDPQVSSLMHLNPMFRHLL